MLHRTVQSSLPPVLLLLLLALPALTAEPRSEHPRPDIVRDLWLSLNGTWAFQFDDQNAGVAERWWDAESGAKHFTRTIQVPFGFQSKLGGIGDTGFHDVVWYRRAFQVPAGWKGKRVRLNFGAVDYRAQVWLNGVFVGGHEGGQVPFSFDITSALIQPGKPGSQNIVVVRAEDPSTDLTIPRGKQYWEPKSRGIWYTRTSGIWQPVWLEPVSDPFVESVIIRPDVDESVVRVEARLSRAAPGMRLRVRVDFAGEFQAVSEAPCPTERIAVAAHLPGQRLWSPERPNLYDATLEILNGETLVDSVKTYFGQRKISTRDGRFYLNNRPYFLKMVLDQGYWPDGILTPPSDEAIQYDIKMTKAFGFNGSRKHQKVEDPRFLYWADKMGLLVSGEMANAHAFNEDYVARMTAEWKHVVLRDINHPSIISWYPINESWGVPQVRSDPRQQDHIRSLYYLTRSLDPTRLVVDNDGWEHTEATDLFTIHDYAPRGDTLASRYARLPGYVENVDPGQPLLLVHGSRYNGTPFVMSEFGGIAYRPAGMATKQEEWGYSGIEPTEEAFLSRFGQLVQALRRNPLIAGYCYTQLTDVEQEINGLMTYDRKPKVDPEKVRKLQTE
jgi:beta-galactosidase/beta-glucuronidase